MGQYPITAGVFGKAIAIAGTGKTGTITDGKPAWVFENQTGDLRNKLQWSQYMVGVQVIYSCIVIPVGFKD